jgi:hypothetical protein
MTDEDRTNVTEIDAHRHEQIIAEMNEANVAVAARVTTLPDLGLLEVRDYVKGKRWREVGGVIFSINEKPNDKTDHPLGKIAFHTLAKELVLSGQHVYITNLSNLVSAIDRAQAMDEDVWLDQYKHLFITNFFKAGEDNPLDTRQVQRIHDFMEARWEKNLYQHVLISGVREGADVNMSKWYGATFWGWFKSVQVQFRY